MFTRTTVTAVRALIYLGLSRATDPVPPRRMAQELGESPSYFNKITQLLAKAGILRAHRGVSGGVLLNHSPEQITLRAVVEACQGTILGDFCRETSNLQTACAFHRAGAELHAAIIGVLSRWTLKDLLKKPLPSPGHIYEISCWMEPRPWNPPSSNSPEKKSLKKEKNSKQTKVLRTGR